MAIHILSAKSVAACRLIEVLSTHIWQGSLIDVVPDHLLITIANNGGVVLLAFDETIPVGFCFGFLGLTADGQLKHCSHRTGVLPAYQGKGVGFGLKLAQRNFIMEQGINLVTWTFDPLQTQNGFLNLHKLGGVCQTYQRNVYGETRDELNNGLPTDRFLVEWWIASDWVKQRICNASVVRDPTNWQSEKEIISGQSSEEDSYQIRPSTITTVPNGNSFFLEVPANFNALKAANPELALEWRLYTRAFFENAFSAGYVVIDLLQRNSRCYYFLSKIGTLTT